MQVHKNWRFCGLRLTSGNYKSSKNHDNKHCKGSKSVWNNHITAQWSHHTKESQRHLVQKEKQQVLPQKSAWFKNQHQKFRETFQWHDKYFKCLPSYLRVITDNIVCNYHPESWLNKWSWNTQDPRRQCISPCWIKVQVPMLVKHWKFCYQQWNFSKAIEQNNNNWEVQSTKKDNPVIYCITGHCRPKKYRHCDKSNKQKLETTS